jgi:hypothetical protein
MNDEIRRIINGMDAGQLGELASAVKDARNRASAVDLHSIKAGMSPADMARAAAEIARVLREG